MYILHLFSFRLQNLLVLVVILPLIACSGGDGGEGGGVIEVEESAINLGYPTSSIDINWVAPTLRSDGSTSLELVEISGYRIDYGVDSGVYTGSVYKSGSNPEVTIQGVPPGTYNMVIVTIDTAGRESKYSPEFIVTFEMVS